MTTLYIRFKISLLFKCRVCNGGFRLAVRMDVKLPGIDCAQAEDLAEKAHAFCPSSKATRGNIEVELNVL